MFVSHSYLITIKMIAQMCSMAATVTGSKMYVMLGQYASSQDLKWFIASAVTTHSGKSFQRSTTLKPKKLCRRSSVQYYFFSFRECPLVLVLESLTRGLFVLLIPSRYLNTSIICPMAHMCSTCDFLESMYKLCYALDLLD